jgi:hypothetical protein
MTEAASSGRPGGGARRALPLLAILALALFAAALAGPGEDGRPLDPRSTGPAGVKALVDSLDELGVDVDVGGGVPGPEASRALLLVDDLNDGEVDELRAWVEAGGVVVVTDPRSDLVPEAIGTTAVAGFGIQELRPRCDVPALRDVGAVLPDPSAALYDTPPGAAGCFPSGDGHWLVIEPVGAGAVVALGGPDVFVNARLGGADHPQLVAGLLAPEAGSVAILRTRRPGEGDAGLLDLVGDNIRLFGLQLLIALLLLVAWRARRLGRPVEEPQPVAIPGSELVTAVGNLWQETDARGRAAAQLQGDLRRTLEQRLGLPAGTPAVELAEAAGARSGVDPAALTAVLTAPAPQDAAALAALARDLEQLRHAVLDPATAGDR